MKATLCVCGLSLNMMLPKHILILHLQCWSPSYHRTRKPLAGSSCGPVSCSTIDILSYISGSPSILVNDLHQISVTLLRAQKNQIWNLKNTLEIYFWGHQNTEGILRIFCGPQNTVWMQTAQLRLCSLEWARSCQWARYWLRARYRLTPGHIWPLDWGLENPGLSINLLRSLR